MPLGAWAQGPASVFITAGQSNADGREFNSHLPSYLLQNGYRHLHYTNCTSVCDGTFTTRSFNDKKGRWAFCDVTNYFIDRAIGSDFYSIKCTYGGTAIAPGVTPAKRPIWYADEAYIDTARAYRNGTVGNGTSLTKSLTEGFAQLADVTLSKLPGGYDVKAIMWHQGESDRHAGKEYYANFKKMIAYMRNAVYRKTGKEKDKHLPFILGTVSHKSRQYSEEVEAAQLRVAQEDEDVYAIDMSQAGLLPDHLHFDSVWTEYLGKKMYNVLVQIGAVKGQPLDIEEPGERAGGLKMHVTKWKDNKRAAVSYTFDDGLLEQYTELFPQLKRYGLKVTFAINGNTINRNEAALASNGHSTDSLVLLKPRMTWAMLRELSDAGHEVTSHGWAHINIKKLSGEARRYEVQHNDTVIWQHTGVFPRTYVYPGNAKDKDGVAFASRDRVGTRTRQISIGSKRNDQWLRQWVRGLIASGTWGVGLTHGISRGYDHFRDPEVLWRHFADVVTLQDSLWVGTFHDVAAYEKERDNVELSVTQQGDIVNVVPKMTLDSRLFNIPLTLVVDGNVAYAKQQGRKLKLVRKGGSTCVDFDPSGGAIEIKEKK
jgi:peptidoglycan/xylan/chitin deacetylase (PgdA/CDA1 family)